VFEGDDLTDLDVTDDELVDAYALATGRAVESVRADADRPRSLTELRSLFPVITGFEDLGFKTLDELISSMPPGPC
jgi:hypothetical protein